MLPKLKVADAAPHEVIENAFWYWNKNGWIINREKLYAASEAQGFRNYSGLLVQVIDKFIYPREPRHYYDSLKQYIDVNTVDRTTVESIFNSYEVFIQKNGKFTIERLRTIEESEIVHDTKTTSLKFYEDCFIHITADAITKHTYDLLPGLIYASRIQPRPYRNGTGGKYIQFLQLACGLDEIHDYISKIVGYYCHEYNDETMGYMVILTDQCADPKDGGRSGKNLFVKLLRYSTTLCDKAGSQTKFDEKIFQTWKDERIFSISDLPKDFDLAYFKNISTGGFVLWKLFNDLETIDISRSPKLIFSTNFSYVCNDGGIQARTISLEFTDFFKGAGGVDTHFGCYFPDDWTDEDWAGYDGFIVQSIQTWIKSGCKMKSRSLSETGWQKLFSIAYGPTVTDIIEAYWDDWCREEVVSNHKFKSDLDSFYAENSISQNFKPNLKKLNKALAEYGQHHDTIYKHDQLKRINLDVVKCRTFERKTTELPF